MATSQTRHSPSTIRLAESSHPDGQGHGGPAAPVFGRRVLTVWVAAVCLIAAVAAATVTAILSERRHALTVARESLGRVAVTMAAHAEKVFDEAEHRLIESDLLLAALPPEEVSARVGQFARQAPDEAAHGLTAVLLFDHTGHVLAPSPLRGGDYSEDPQIVAALASPHQATTYSPPRTSRRSDALVIAAVRRVSPNPHGVSLAYTAIAIEPFLTLYSEIRPGARGVVALMREDGMVIAHQPNPAGSIGRSVGGPAEAAIRTGEQGFVEGVSVSDGTVRLIAFHRVGDFPFFGVVAAEKREVLALAGQRSLMLGAMGGTLCLLVAAGAGLHTAQLRRDARQVSALEASRAALERVAAIVEEMQAPVVVTDREGRTEWVNPAFTQLSGFSLEDMAGRKPSEVLQGPETDRETAAAIGRAVREGKAFDAELLNYTKAGRPHWIRLTGNPVRDRNGTLTRFIAVQIDITARREAEARAAEASRLSALGQLAGGIAHDMNNLLMVISLNLELLAESGLEKSAEAMAQAALGATMRGHDLTRQLLSFAQRAADPSGVTDLASLLGGLVPLLAKAMPEGIRIVTDLRCAGHCRGDAGTLESALTNLVMNARDALGGQGRVVIECERAEIAGEEALRLAIGTGLYVRITVSDDGPGIPREMLGRVLEPFFTTKERGKGTGLGLSMAYGFARQVGGTLTIASAPGSGTSVSLYLPLTDQQAESAPAAPEAAQSLRGRSILVVDDEPQILVLLDRMLRAAGLEVTRALDPEQARASLDAARPDVLLADVRLADGASGLDVADAARARWPGLPVIFMTGDPGPDFAQRIGAFPDATVLQKPFSRTELAAVLGKVLPAAELGALARA